MGWSSTFRAYWRRKIKKKYSKCHLCSENKKKLKKSCKSILFQSFLNSSYVTCVQRSLQLRRNYSNIGYVYTLLLSFNCYLCNTLYNLQNYAKTYEFQASWNHVIWLAWRDSNIWRGTHQPWAWLWTVWFQGQIRYQHEVPHDSPLQVIKCVWSDVQWPWRVIKAHWSWPFMLMF